MSENFKIQRKGEVKNVHEFIVDFDGWRYFVIFGEHMNGWFIAIPNHGVCTESGHPEDNLYNSNKIAKMMNSATIGVLIAREILEYWNDLGEQDD